MVVGTLFLELNIPGARSLKDKRAVLNRVKERVRNNFNVSIAEVDANDIWNLACLGVAVVSNDQRFANQVLDKVLDLVETIHDCDVADCRLEFLYPD